MGTATKKVMKEKIVEASWRLARGEHMVAPHDERHERDGDRGEGDGAVAEDRLAARKSAIISEMIAMPGRIMM
jgi:hypothetical protein